jgi:hypothetical protein
MSTKELPMNAYSRARALVRWLIAAVAMLSLAMGTALAVHRSGHDDTHLRIEPYATTTAPAAATGGLIDHSVVDRPDLDSSADTSGMSVAAYGS